MAVSRLTEDWRHPASASVWPLVSNLVKRHGWFIALIGVGLVLRLWNFAGPTDDLHEWRQTFTLMNAESYGHGAGWLAPFATWFGLHPKPAGLEFPLYPIVVYVLSRLLGLLTAARIVSLVCGVASIFLFDRICSRLDHPRRYAATTLFALAPLAIFYSHATQPEPLLLLLVLATAYAALRAPAVGWTAVAAICFAGAAAIKPTAFIILLPPLAYLFVKRSGRVAIASIAVAGAIGLIGWSLYNRSMLLQTSPEWYGMNTGFWLSDPLKTLLDMRYYWTLATRDGFALIPAATIVFAIVAARRRWGHPFWWWWMAGAGAELLMFGSVNWAHIYYQLPIVPALAALAAYGAPAWPRRLSLQVAAFAGLIVATLYGAWPLYQQDPRYLDAGHALAAAAEPGPPVLVLSRLADPWFPSVLYYADRPGWTLPLNTDAATIEALPGMPPCDLVKMLDGPAPSQLPAGWIETARTSEYVLAHRRSATCP
jgi:dolichyl-phosphate-mannose-protein mannosyltransferase